MKNTVVYRLIDVNMDVFNKKVDLYIDCDTQKIDGVITFYNDKFTYVKSNSNSFWDYLQEIILTDFSSNINYEELKNVLCEEEYNKIISIKKDDNMILEKSYYF